MKKLGVIGIVFSIVIMMLCSGCLQSDTGVLILKITDAPSVENITHVNITISEVMVHRNAAVNNTTAGWETIVNQSQHIDLIALTNVTQVFGSANLSAGRYTQIRLLITACNITVNGTIYNCTVPSEALKLTKTFEIVSGQNTTLILDFDAKESIHETGNQQYRFTPVIQIIQE